MRWGQASRHTQSPYTPNPLDLPRPGILLDAVRSLAQDPDGLGVLQKKPSGAGRPNAWRLSSNGEQVLDALNG